LWLSFTKPRLGLPLIWRRLSGCHGGLSTMTRTLELHLEWGISTSLSRACTFSCFMRMLDIYEEVGGDLETWLVKRRLLDSQFSEIVSRAQIFSYLFYVAVGFSFVQF
jgi:hypothetical protein